MKYFKALKTLWREISGEVSYSVGHVFTFTGQRRVFVAFICYMHVIQGEKSVFLSLSFTMRGTQRLNDKWGIAGTVMLWSLWVYVLWQGYREKDGSLGGFTLIRLSPELQCCVEMTTAFIISLVICTDKAGLQYKAALQEQIMSVCSWNSVCLLPALDLTCLEDGWKMAKPQESFTARTFYSMEQNCCDLQQASFIRIEQ